MLQSSLSYIFEGILATPLFINLHLMTINMAVKEKLMFILLEGLLIYREMALVNVDVNSFKRQPHKMVKHAQTICRLLPTNC